MNGKHTPGPWHVCGEQSGITENSDTRHVYAQADKDAGGTGCVACVASSTANAALISAAPDMLEALRGLLVIVDQLNHDAYKHGGPLREGESHEWLEQVKARAAIRKATGEQ